MMVKLTGREPHDAVFWCQECGRKDPVYPRKRTMAKPKRLQAYVDEETYARVLSAAEASSLSVSEYVARVVSDGHR